MAAQEFKHLFSPLKIGAMMVPNRIVFPAHWTCFFVQDEPPNERLMHYLLTQEKLPLPALDSTGLLARAALKRATRIAS